MVLIQFTVADGSLCPWPGRGHVGGAVIAATGTVITRDPVVRYSPLARGSKSEVVTTQYDGDMLPKLGLLKVDFLGLRTLSIIDDAVKSVRAGKDPSFDIDKVPFDDAKTFELLRSAKALAVFQLDSQGMRDLLFRIKPTAQAGRAFLNLRHNLSTTQTQLNEGGLDLQPDPSNEAGDVLDGWISIQGRRRSPRPRWA